MGMSENEFKISDGLWGPIFLPHINTKRQKPKWVDLGLKPRCFVKVGRSWFETSVFCKKPKVWLSKSTILHV